jgi:putative ABC transport system substrate-binding protein
MRRRQFLVGAVAATSWPLTAKAQRSGKLPRIGMLWPNSAEAVRRLDFVPALHTRLRELGWVDGRTIVVEERFADGDKKRLEQLAAELVRLPVDLIVTGAEGTIATARATKEIPIVTAAFGDPIAEGLAASLAHPGGNVTGNAVLISEIMAKRLEALKTIAPSVRIVGLLTVVAVPLVVLDTMSATARTSSTEVKLFELSQPTAYDDTFATAAAAGVRGFVIFDSARVLSDSDVIAAQASKFLMPTAGAPFYARSGGLFGYAVNFKELFSHAATFVDKILNGAKPGDIPFEQATHFQVTVNLKTARVLGLEIPPTILAAADEVIE